MKLPFSLTRTFFGLCLGASVFALSAQQAVPPPEANELQAVRQISEIPVRIKELRRIKAAYPQSAIMSRIDAALLDAVSQNADSLDKLLAAQGEIIDNSSNPSERFSLISNAINMILAHSKVDAFSKPAVVKAVQDYRSNGLKLVDDPEFASHMSPGRRDFVIGRVRTTFDIPLVKAHLLNGDSHAALNVLEKTEETLRDVSWYNTLGSVYLEMKRDREALGAFFEAAAEGDRNAIASARNLYAKLNGSSGINDNSANFYAELDKVRGTRPFQPPPFTPPANWKGKAVLAEVFTGSECGPCVAATYGFDGLKETYPTQYLAVLKYHLPIPTYDPMMNHATTKRQDYYKVNSTPTAIIDGVEKVPAGGGRTASFATFSRAKDVIDSFLTADANITIKASGVISGDAVQVNCEFSKVIESADYHVLLVQTEEEFKGANGIVTHKMVVRDIETIRPTDKATVTFNIPASEKAAEAHIAAWGETVSQSRKGSKWPIKQNIIDRNKLKAVIFVQDTNSKQVYNAFVTDLIPFIF